MAEKVIHEFRFIETDDGFRIEIKGDKDKMRKMGFGPDMGKHFGCGTIFGQGFSPGFGPGMHFWRHKKGGRRGPGFGPPWTWWDWDEEEESEPPKKA